ncbi:DUF1028 domain-containing protein [Martelella endophytica]|uniref:DUF1028 domain-containing protein n=1 Tax=Martelella endophytica TaxID=1486262 RepID=A0A0D5LMP9_MAREN|nr:DUF1028 domain-containing protein [Martelella endophytica]AJY45052.1 hypothetical protein TM49_04075 [Martelella endophytica]
MTYTVVARDPDTARLGVVIATRAPVVGARCPVVVPHFGAASVQLIASPPLTQLCARLISQGYSAPKVLEELKSSDPHIQRRQIGIVDVAGNTAAFSGPTTNGFSGHILGEQFVAMGNAVISEEVVNAMAAIMKDRSDLAFADRLMAAIEAGTEAGGQADGQFSGGILVYDRDNFAEIDLRVDRAEGAVAELRKLYDWYRPLIPYYVERATDPYMERDDHWRARQAREGERQ